MKSKMSELDWAAWMLVMLGAINWGLVGAFKFDLVQIVLGTSPLLAQIVNVLVGCSGVYWMVKTVRTR